MASPATEDLREIERELTIAAEQGETRSFARLREDFGLGHEDLEQALATLREHGKAVEAAPGEWRGPMMDELTADTEGKTEPRVQVHVGEGEAELDEAGLVPADGRHVDRPGGVAPWGTPLSSPQFHDRAVDVRLTRAIADALTADAVGSIVKAGLSDVEDGEIFVLEVTP